MGRVFPQVLLARPRGPRTPRLHRAAGSSGEGRSSGHVAAGPVPWDNLAKLMSAPLKTKLDYDDLATAPEDGNRYELLDGDLFVTPAPSPQHQRASKRLQRQLEHYFEERGLGEVFNAPLDVILTRRDVVEPDLVVVADAQQISARGIEGAPMLVVEILSPSTAQHDRTVKAKRYEATGVRHYWVVDLDARRLDCYRLTDHQYVLAVSITGDEPFEHPDWSGLQIDPGVLWS